MFENAKYFLNALQRGASVKEALKLTRENLDVDLSLNELKAQVERLKELKSKGQLGTFEAEVGSIITNNKVFEVEEKIEQKIANLEKLNNK